MNAPLSLTKTVIMGSLIAHGIANQTQMTTSPNPLRFDSLPVELKTILAIESSKRVAEQQAKLITYFRSIDPELKKLSAALDSQKSMSDPRLIGVQDLAWVLINSPEFLFNH